VLFSTRQANKASHSYALLPSTRFHPAVGK